MTRWALVVLVGVAACRPESHGQGRQVLVPPTAPGAQWLRSEPGTMPRVAVPEGDAPRALGEDTHRATVLVPIDDQTRVLRAEPAEAVVAVPADQELPPAMRRRVAP
ncbi:hypothetical protein [Paraliomyxa miuraensis]|uniref:hypothetical protein n=1 Tax=Paraliomyxa miuraensis TaxID=376150 RepID=UPI002253A803|nr:hypothetical protein [Paraliomyxa miuraensis]MCX4245133.1 hypothetical protein [Paraliomyxa miuraensis]